MYFFFSLYPLYFILPRGDTHSPPHSLQFAAGSEFNARRLLRVATRAAAMAVENVVAYRVVLRRDSDWKRGERTRHSTSFNGLPAQARYTHGVRLRVPRLRAWSHAPWACGADGIDVFDTRHRPADAWLSPVSRRGSPAASRAKMLSRRRLNASLSLLARHQRRSFAVE